MRRACAALARRRDGIKSGREGGRDEGSPVSLVERLLAAAVDAGASDVHVEPLRDRVRVRVRVDGILRELSEFATAELPAVVSRLKIMAEADIAERRRHQDGRLEFEHPDTGAITDLRASFYVTVRGECTVLRVLNQANRVIELERVGMAPTVLTRFRSEALETPSGVVIVTGPTGSGKTSTLYSCVHHLADDATSIVTAEDPVEYQLDGISQCSVAPKLGRTFEESLRHIVRQDPDVIVLGEIRDASSAESAIQAALTGHKVLTTFHTEDSVGAVLRLLNMDIESFLIASTVSCVVAQRLVRRVCAACAVPAVPDAAELAGVGWREGDVDGARFVEGVGCASCQFTGYRGRIAVFEALVLNEAVREAILERSNSTRIRRVSLESSGLVTLLEDGLAKASRGETTLAEIRSLRDATVRLGVRQVAAIVMSVSQKRLYSASPGPLRERLTALSRHAQAASLAARWIAVRAGFRTLADETYVAALLHDVGKLSLLRIVEGLAREGKVRLTHQMVDMALSHLHCRHGARLLELWNLPAVYRDVVLRLEDETVPDGALTLATVRLADRVCAPEGASDRPDPNVVLEALPETGMLGLCDIDPAELRIHVEDLASGAGAETGGVARAA